MAALISEYNLLPVLDICCGTGAQCHRIEKYSRGAFGLDWDFKMIQYAASRHRSIPFICSNAEQIPFSSSTFKGVIISYALHDKSPETREKMLKEARRILKPEGNMVLVDFESPWSRRSKFGDLFTTLIELTAGKDHFKNQRFFLKQGGLKNFIKTYGLVEVKRFGIELAHTSVVMARFATE